ncbi:MAG: heat-shock protein Hsp20 [Bacteroidetes bacterium 46-16]|nr:MAG: heat-shock protein Hsp20 [Bacteroidetes bacterium 46-16]
MSLKTLMKANDLFPASLNDLFKPWNEWFDDANWNKPMLSPAVNISENDKEYNMTVAAPGLKKGDFRIDVEDNMLTVSAQQQENKEEKDKTYTRKEYNYSSFSRSFNLPEEVSKEQIEASYTDGVLTVCLPKKESTIKTNTKSIKVN